MSTQLYLVPQTFDASGRLVPKYLATDLAGKTWVAMPYGIEGIVLLASDPNPALGAEPDVFAFPASFFGAPTPIGLAPLLLSAADVSRVQAFFQANNIPSKNIGVGMKWRDLARAVAQFVQIAQRHNGLTGSAIFSTNTAASLAAQSAAIVNNTVMPSAPVQVGTSPTLSSSLSTLPTVQTNLGVVAASFGFAAPDSNRTVEDALTFLGGQFVAPIRMDRGDGFSISA